MTTDEAQTAAPSETTGATGRKAETQQRIVAAAMSLFAARGFERTSIAAIASQAGVSRSAVFWHFGDKEGLFREAFRRMLVPFFDEFHARVRHMDPRKRIFDIFDAYERVVTEYEDTIRTIVRWLLESEKLRAAIMDTVFRLHEEFTRELCHAFEESLADTPDAAPLAAAIVSLLDGNLLLGMIDAEPRGRELRAEGLRLLTRRVLGDRPGE